MSTISSGPPAPWSPTASVTRSNSLAFSRASAPGTSAVQASAAFASEALMEKRVGRKSLMPSFHAPQRAHRNRTVNRARVGLRELKLDDVPGEPQHRLDRGHTPLEREE